MKTLVLIRHAKSSWEHLGLKDIERPLNEVGHKAALKMSDFLFTKINKVDSIISSPAVRANTTAHYFAKVYDFPIENIDTRNSVYDAMPSDIIEVAQSIDNKHNIVLMFGHNPAFTYVVNSFSKDFIDNVPTCGVNIIESSAEKWEEFSTQNSKLVGHFAPKKI